MTATTRNGFVDAYHSSRLSHLAGTTYPSAPSNTYIGIYSALPLSDGTGGTEISPATRPGITLGSVVTDATGRQYVTHAAAINNIALTNTSACEIVGYGLHSASSGSTLIFVLPCYPHQVQPGASISLTAGTLKFYSD